MANNKSKTARSKRPVIYNMTENLCVWAEAGVIEPTQCINAYNCMTCPLDKKMQRSIAQGKLEKGHAPLGWRNANGKERVAVSSRKCRHMLSGRVSVKYCMYNYDCARCPYDQFIDEEDLVVPVSDVKVDYVAGFAVARNYYYHQGHGWARVEYGGRIRVKLDDFALRLVGPLDEIRLPSLGTVVRQGEPNTGLVRGENRAETLCPVEGTVVACNPKVAAASATASRDPYGQGWLMVIEPRMLGRDLKNLLYEKESLGWIDDEFGRLAAMVSEETDYQLAATGGRAVSDIYGTVPEIGWDRLVDAFLSG